MSKSRGNLPDSRSDSPEPSVFTDPNQGRQLTPRNSARPSTGTPTTNKQPTPPRGSTWPATGTPKVDSAKPLIQPLSAYKKPSRTFDNYRLVPEDGMLIILSHASSIQRELRLTAGQKKSIDDLQKQHMQQIRSDVAKLQSLPPDKELKWRDYDRPWSKAAQRFGARLLGLLNENQSEDFRKIIERGTLFPFRDGRELNMVQQLYVKPLDELSVPVAWKADADPGKFAWSSRSFDTEKVPPAFRIRFPSSPSPFLLISDHVIDENGVAGNNNLVHLMVYDMRQQSVVSKVSKSLAYLNGCDCEVSPNGKRLARIESLHILIWDAATAEELHRINTIKPDHPGKLEYIEFAGPDRLVSFHGEETVRVYDVQSGKKLNEFQLILPLKGLGGHPGRKVRVSPGGRFLATLHIRNEAPQKRVLRLHVYDLKSGEHVGNPLIAENLSRLVVQDLVFSDDGEEVAALLYQQRERDFVIVSWDMKQGRQNGFYGPFPPIQTRPSTKERHLVWLKDKTGWVHSGHQLVLRETGKETEIGDPDQGIRHDAQIIGPNTMLQFWETKPRRTARNEMVPVVVNW